MAPIVHQCITKSDSCVFAMMTGNQRFKRVAQLNDKTRVKAPSPLAICDRRAQLLLSCVTPLFVHSPTLARKPRIQVNGPTSPARAPRTFLDRRVFFFPMFLVIFVCECVAELLLHKLLVNLLPLFSWCFLNLCCVGLWCLCLFCWCWCSCW